jgi:hypothetical protein
MTPPRLLKREVRVQVPGFDLGFECEPSEFYRGAYGDFHERFRWVGPPRGNNPQITYVDYTDFSSIPEDCGAASKHFGAVAIFDTSNPVDQREAIGMIDIPICAICEICG